MYFILTAKKRFENLVPTEAQLRLHPGPLPTTRETFLSASEGLQPGFREDGGKEEDDVIRETSLTRSSSLSFLTCATIRQNIVNL